MSQPSSDLDNLGGDLQPVEQEPQLAAPPAPVRKQGFTFYTVMMIMSFTFLTIATILLFIEVSKFN